MKLKNWYEIRGPKFIWQRGKSLLERYDLKPEKAMDRIKDCVAELTEVNCAPTFFTPGIIVQRYPQFICSLQDAGVEIAVHGYHHINLRDLPVAVAVEQLMRAAHTFQRFGFETHGFRCPYMGCTDELVVSIPAGVFGYSSNQSIYWGNVEDTYHQDDHLFFDTLKKFYKPNDSSQKYCLPWMFSGMVEIPVCVPDDLQLYDGLQLDNASMADAWNRVLQRTYQRGELFNLLFHTELASILNHQFCTLIRQAQRYQPGVWIACLREINDWWREKSRFSVEITAGPASLRLNFACSPRATILVRGIDCVKSTPIWDGNYHKLQSIILDVPAKPRPFVGLAADAPEGTVSFLRDQGYLLDAGETARSCGIYLDNESLGKLDNEVELVNAIEASSAPLVRFWRWPNGMKSALCITGDLDALSLYDYASRVFIG